MPAGTPAALAPRGMEDLGVAFHRRWVRVGILVTLVGYTAVTVGDVLIFHDGARVTALLSQVATVLACAVALALAWRDKVRLGAGITLAAVWLELHSGLPTMGLQLSALIAFPVLISAGGILLGGRAGYALAGLTCVTLPVGASLSGWMGGTAGMDAQAMYLWLVVTASMFASAALVQLGLDSFGRVLATARASEQRLGELLENAPYGVVASDEHGAVLSVNPAAEAILGARQDALAGLPLNKVLKDAADGPGEVARLEELLGGEGRREAPVSFRGPGPGSLSTELVVAPIHWADGSVGRQVTIRDVTEQQGAREREQLLRAQLEHAQRLEAVGRLAGGVAHEFNNLLTVVGGAAELLLLDSQDTDPSLAREILDAKSRGASLTRQLLAFARKELVQPTRLDLAVVAGDMEPLLKRFVTEKHTLVLEMASDVPLVVADQSQVEQVMVNLVVNARDALDRSGRITLGLAGPETTQRWGDEAWTIPADQVELWVEDTGKGMDPEVAERAFEPFFTTKPRGQGTGLGLATVHGIVSQNDGTIHVHSRPGAGTRVSIRWPIKGDPE